MNVSDDLFASTLYSRALAGQQGLVQLFFRDAVLEKYRGKPGYTIKRTDSAGRVKQEGGWGLDYGIAADHVIHASLQEVSARLPERERSHWLDHMLIFPVSSYFLQVQLAPGSCLNDGDIRDG